MSHLLIYQMTASTGVSGLLSLKCRMLVVSGSLGAAFIALDGGSRFGAMVLGTSVDGSSAFGVCTVLSGVTRRRTRARVDSACPIEAAGRTVWGALFSQRFGLSARWGKGVMFF